MSDIDLTGQSTLHISQSLCPYYKLFWYKTKSSHQKVTSDNFYVFNDNIKTRLQENARPITIFYTKGLLQIFSRSWFKCSSVKYSITAVVFLFHGSLTMGRLVQSRLHIFSVFRLMFFDQEWFFSAILSSSWRSST